MKIYIIYYFNDDAYGKDEKNIIKIMTDLNKANQYAEECINDNWRIQDGYQYESIIRSDKQTMLYKLTLDEKSIGYYVECYEVDNVP